MAPYIAELTVLVAGALDVAPDLWTRIAPAITRRNGRLVTVGTGRLIAAFGKEAATAPEAAVEAALALRDELREWHPFPLTVVIASGALTVHPHSAGSGFELAGELLDLATQLLFRKLRSGGGIFLAGIVSPELRDRFRLRDDNDRGTPLKGRAEPVPLSEILGTSSNSVMAQLHVGGVPEAAAITLEHPAHQRESVTAVTIESPAQNAMPAVPPGMRQHIVTDRPPLTSLNKVSGGMLGAMQRSPPSPPDWVTCTVFAPPTVGRAEAILVQIFAHLSEASGEAAALASEFDPAATRRGFQSLETKIARGTWLTFELTMRDVEIDGPVARRVWNGRTEAVQFGVSIPNSLKPGAIIGTVTVSHDSVPVGHLKFKLQVVGAPETARAAEPVGESARRYKTAFVSYASQDRDKVLARVQMLRPLGISYFQDVLDLEPGTRWQQELYRRIDDCDLFLLFWSESAKRSPWVLKEVEYALARKGEDEFGPPEIMPVILEGPPIPLPPPALEHLHFNDRLIYFLSGAAS